MMVCFEIGRVLWQSGSFSSRTRMVEGTALPRLDIDCIERMLGRDTVALLGL